MSFSIVMFSIFLVIPVVSRAQTTPCVGIKDYRQIVTCAESNSPEVVRAELMAKERKASTDAAAQLLNPELSLESVSGSLDSERRSETDLSLAFPIELGGKRAARKDFAVAEFSRAELELFRVRTEVRKEVLLKLFRLRQISEELELIDESIQTFSKLVKQYESRPALSPEQEVSLTVFKVAKGDYGFKRMSYDEEILSLSAFFKLATGLPVDVIKANLPPKIEKWPKMKADTGEAKNSPLVSLYEADIQIAKAELSKAQGDSWPTMSLGPSAKITKEGDREFQQWGVNLSVPIPVLSLNRGGRSVAAASVYSSEQKRNLALKRIESEREALANTYKKSVNALEETPNGHSLESKHKKIESFFFRGLVPSSLVIEAHRSLVDFEKTRNERELRAIEAFLEIQIIDGDSVGGVL